MPTLFENVRRGATAARADTRDPFECLRYDLTIVSLEVLDKYVKTHKLSDNFEPSDNELTKQRIADILLGVTHSAAQVLSIAIYSSTFTGKRLRNAKTLISEFQKHLAQRLTDGIIQREPDSMVEELTALILEKEK